MGDEYDPENTSPICVKDPHAPGGTRCVRAHAAHLGAEELAMVLGGAPSAPASKKAAAAGALLRVEEILFVTIAFLREKYLRGGAPSERAARFQRTVAPRGAASFRIARLSDLLSAPGTAQLQRAMGALPRDPATRKALAGLVRTMLARWQPHHLSEGSPYNDDGETAFTVEKGRSMVFCLRPRANGLGTERGDASAHAEDIGPEEVYPENLLSFVALHELAHVYTESFAHPPRYWEHFRWLLEEAQAAGIFRSVRYARAPRMYCGLFLNHNPMHDGITADIRALAPGRWGSMIDKT
jgi:hypothetical protein